MFEKLGDIIKRRFVSAFRTVMHGFSEFLPFYLTMFAIIFALITSSFFITQGYETEKADIEAAYNYHVAVKGLNQSQMINIRDDTLTVFLNDYVYRTVSMDTHHSSDTGSTSYDLYLRLLTGNKNYGFMGIFIEDTLESNLDSFLTRYNRIIYPDPENEVNDITITTSPLYDLEAHEKDTKILKLAILSIISVISAMLLTGVYSIRVNNQKFLYGIYATFGADRKRLCATSAYEILVCAGSMLIPALICSLVFCNRVFLNTSTGFNFSLSPLLITLPFILIIVLAATYFPLKRLSMQEPMSMIVAQDNSNLVSSPRRSANMLNITFPTRYELLTLWRFRWRTLKLLALSAIFCSMFVSGLYLATLYEANEDIKADTSVAFAVSFADGIPEDAIKEIESLNGVRAVHQSYNFISAESLASHILINKANASSNDLHTYKIDESYYIDNDFSYISANDADVLEYFESLYDTYGDSLDVINGKNTVMIGVSKGNKNVYDFKVGDAIQIGIIFIPQPPTISINAEENAVVWSEVDGAKGYNVYLDGTYFATTSNTSYELANVTQSGTYIITVAAYNNASESSHSNEVSYTAIISEGESETPVSDIEQPPITSGENDENLAEQVTGSKLLDRQLDMYEFEYITVTVGAIIYDYPSALYGTPLIMSDELYKYITNGIPGAENNNDTLNVYLNDNLVGKDIDRVEFNIRDMMEKYKNTKVVATGVYHDSLIEESKQYSSLITVLSICILIAVPIIWFFSQILFYNRRSAEFDILMSMAATDKSILKLHLSSSMILGVASILSLPFSALCIYSIYALFTYILPTEFKVGAEVVIGLQNEWWTYLICVILTITCSILASIIPFTIYRKKKLEIEKKSNFTVD